MSAITLHEYIQELLKLEQKYGANMPVLVDSDGYEGAVDFYEIAPAPKLASDGWYLDPIQKKEFKKAVRIA